MTSQKAVGVYFFRVAALFFGLSCLSPLRASDGRMVLDIFPDRIEASLQLPARAVEKVAAGSDLRGDLSVYLQSHLLVFSSGNQPMATEVERVALLSDDFVDISLIIYPSGDMTPGSFVISGDLLQTPAARQTLEVFLRRDAAEMRFGLEPPIPLGRLDYFHRSLRVDREPLAGIGRGVAAVMTVSRLMLASGTALVFIALLLLRATLAGRGSASVTFLLSATSMAVFAATTGAMLLAGMMPSLGWMVVVTVLLLSLSALALWRPHDWRPALCLALGAGWLTGVSWNEMAIARSISGVDTATLLYLAVAFFFVLAILMVLVLPTFILVARRLPSLWLKWGGAVCGVIVALHLLTSFTLRQ